MFVDVYFNSDFILEKRFKTPFLNYNIFERDIYWLNKLGEYPYFPSIIDIDYINHILHLDIELTLLNTELNKDLNSQMKEIFDILKTNNCQLNGLVNTDIIVKNNRIFILNMYWCLDNSLPIDEGLNLWEKDTNTYQIKRSNFVNNEFILKELLKLKTNLVLDLAIYIIYIDNLQSFLINKIQIWHLLLRKNIIIVKNSDDLDTIKGIIVNSVNKNIDIRISLYSNILEDYELLKYICLNFKITMIVNINLSEDIIDSIFRDEESLNKNINLINNNTKGLLIKKKYIKSTGFFGNLDNCIEIRKLCMLNKIDFKNYIMDKCNYIDWNKYKKYLKNQNTICENDCKLHWIVEGIEKNLDLFWKFSDCLEKVPLKIFSNNFIINISIFQDKLEHLIINQQNEKIICEFLLYLFNYYNKDSILIID